MDFLIDNTKFYWKSVINSYKNAQNYLNTKKVQIYVKTYKISIQNPLRRLKIVKIGQKLFRTHSKTPLNKSNNHKHQK